MSVTHALHTELHARADAWRRERAHERLATAGLVPARDPAARQAAQALASLVLDWLDAGGMLTASGPEAVPSRPGPTSATPTRPPMLTELPTRQRHHRWATWAVQRRMSQRFAVRARSSPQFAGDAVRTELSPGDRELAPKEAPRDAASPATLAPSGGPDALTAPEPNTQRVPPPAVRPPESSTPSKPSGPPPSAASLQDLAAHFKPSGAKAATGKPSVTLQLSGARRQLSPDWETDLRAMLEALGSPRAADAAQRLVAVTDDPRWVGFPDDVLGGFLHFLVARCRAAQAANPVPYVHARLDKAFDTLRKAQQRNIPSTFVHGMKRDSLPQRADN